MIAIISEEYPVQPGFFKKKLEPLARKIGVKGKITIKLGSEEESRSLNRRYRRKDHPTDVLTFPDGERTPDGLYAGDILICYPVAEKQARKNGRPPERELLLLMVHGLLHLKGYDHETDGGEMLRLQEELMKSMIEEG
jgi:probable rRNA maturation factor